MSRQERLVLVVSILASSVAFLDGAIVNVALPAIQNDLGGGLSTQQWVVDAYLLTLGSLILLAGSLSDLLGRKRILKLGLWGFGLASILCAAAPSSETLILARALQGIAGALLVPSSLALIMSAFSGAAQGRAIGSWTAWTGIAFVIGPLLGGLFVDYGSWRWIFAINVLPIAATLYLIQKLQIVDKRQKVKVDVWGAILVSVGLASLVAALMELPVSGLGDPWVYLSLIGGLLLIILFLIREFVANAPMLPLSLFKNRNFSVGNVATAFIYAGLSAGTFLIPIFLQQVAGFSALAAGMALLPVTIIMFFLSSRFGTLAGKYGARLFMGAGPLLAAVGFLAMTQLSQNVAYWTDLLPAILIFGLGLSITVAPLTAAILGDVPKIQSGIASAVNNAVARVAGLLAIAAIGAVLSSQFTAAVIAKEGSAPIDEHGKPLLPTLSLSGHQEFADASVAAFHAGAIFTAGLLAAGGMVSLVGIRNKPSEAADGVQ